MHGLQQHQVRRLGCFSVAVTKHQGNAYKKKHLTWGLMVPEHKSLVIRTASLATGRQTCTGAGAESSHLEAITKCMAEVDGDLWNLQAHSQ